METNTPAQTAENISPIPPVSAVSAAPAVCPVCHQPTLPEYYFCPNCGAKLNMPPLSTSVGAQTWLYAFSIILPVICFLAVSKWQGPKYYKSPDPKTKKIGTIACALLAFSTVFTIWYAVIWTRQEIQSQVNSINADMST